MAEHSESRPALGLAVTLGALYDARSEKVLGQSLLNAGILPPELVVEQDLPRQTYHHTTTDCLEEKFHNLDISAELGVSILCGMLTSSWGAKYLSQRKSSDRLQEASAVCTLRTKSEILQLGEALKPHLNMDLFTTTEATHVVWQIEWGAQVVVMAKREVRDESSNFNLSERMAINPQGTQDSPGALSSKSIASRIIRCIGQPDLSAEGTSQADLKSISTSFDFELIAEGVGNESIPRDFEGVSEFVRAIPSHVSTVNGGKGVPITIHLLPLTELAKLFRMDVAHNHLVQRLDKNAVDRALERLIELETVVRSLSSYFDLLEQHTFCVPNSQIKRARKYKRRAEEDEADFKKGLRTTIVGFRSGSIEMGVFYDLLDQISTEDDARELDKYRSITDEYVGKIAFANAVKAKGAMYLKHASDELDNAIIQNDTDDLYILYFSEAMRKESTWSRNRQVLLDLLDDPPPNSRVIIVDFDRDTSRSFEPSLKEPCIEHRRGGKVIVSDVAKELEELQDMDLVRCNDDQFSERLTIHPPPGRRTLRTFCPGSHCSGRPKSAWSCPKCRELVAYGYEDQYIYCYCRRYLASHAAFKCRHKEHGNKFVKYENDADLRNQLENLDPDEVYNILLLGKSGVGKSMFINSFSMYNQFATLDEAIADPEPMEPIIPFSFSWQDANTNDHYLAYGNESSGEKFSNKGESATKRTMLYHFPIKGKTFRFIDTPGILDTGGLNQDRLNMKDVFHTLKAIDKLSAVLFLLQPNETRMDDSFKFCITELLNHLHQDAAYNIMFGFTNAFGTNFTLGATAVTLDQMLRDLQDPIARRQDNQFFFDAGGYKFLAHYKKTGEMWLHKNQYDFMWEESVKQSDKLMLAVMRLPPHDLRKTLRLNQARVFLDAMAKPLTHFLATMEKSKRDLDRAKQELDEIEVKGQNLQAELAKVRDADGKMRTNYHIICHENCNVDAPDEIAGHLALKRCNPFWRFPSFSTGNDCYQCQHNWKEHMRISYEMRDEEREMDDPNTTSKIESNEKARQKIQEKSQEYAKIKMAIEGGQRQIYETRAQIGVYLQTNSIGGVYSDGSLSHYAIRILMAKREGQHDMAAQLVGQRMTYEATLKSLREAVEQGTVECPSEDAVESAIMKLEEMPIFGSFLRECIEEDRIMLDVERHVYIGLFLC
ncbi:hypothetical protein G7Z17_g1935 [Cylindrodendrum hubeiense]|uniref:G domain-containing protein n=1 Tax=Cylindrodendrum hubeiense TaxID=595255 RepID=A0A9P5LLJ9_9HYPO|nr:hypothetical protein G7Z17_g1935 [Cylindrodendrum hubeiense]